MAKIPIELDVDDAVEEIVTKLERRLEKVEKENEKLTKRNTELETIFGKMKKVRDTIVEATDWLEPYRYDDD